MTRWMPTYSAFSTSQLATASPRVLSASPPVIGTMRSIARPTECTDSIGTRVVALFCRQQYVPPARRKVYLRRRNALRSRVPG